MNTAKAKRNWYTRIASHSCRAAVLAGAVGNLHDRIVYGGVRDWIFWYYQSVLGSRQYEFTWPIFNLADCFLIAGACLLVLQGLLTPDPKKSEPITNTPAPAATGASSGIALPGDVPISGASTRGSSTSVPQVPASQPPLGVNAPDRPTP